MILQKIKRPTFLISREKVKKNIAFMVKKAKEDNILLRPHFKTHQSIEIAHCFRQFGIDKITVSSFSMAKYFAADAWKDITIAFPLNIRELDDIIRLAEEIQINVLISSTDAALCLSQRKPKRNISYFIKIDAGYGRAGIEPENIDEISEIMKICRQNKKISFKGFLAHFGNTYNAKNREEVLHIYQISKERLIVLKNHFITDFPELILSVGDTPSSVLSFDFLGIDEIRPGNFVFYDLMQHFIAVCTLRQIAVVLACPVVAIYPERKELLLYCGAVHLSKEYITDSQGNKIFGQIVTLDNEGWQIPDQQMYLKSISQEHGIADVQPDFMKTIKIGDLVGILPVHSCLTANLMKENTLIF